eukprot:scaffold2431_cov235-Pinguiococcus_pyrenoidosus.AAC.1
MDAPAFIMCLWALRLRKRRRRQLENGKDPARRKKARRGNLPRERLDWDARLVYLELVGHRAFEKRYRCSKSDFYRVLNIIRPSITRDETKAKQSSPGGLVQPELRLSMAIRFLCGSDVLDIADLHGVSEKTAYVHIWETLQAIDSAAELAIRFPLSEPEQLAKLAAEFAAVNDGSLPSVIGALDGICLPLRCPRDSTAYVRVRLNMSESALDAALHVVDVLEERKELLGLVLLHLAMVQGDAALQIVQLDRL